MNAFCSFSVPWLLAIGSMKLHLYHNIVISPLLLRNGSFASIHITNLCFLAVNSVMNRIRWGTINDWIDSVFSNALLRIVHCWVKYVAVLDGSIEPWKILYTNISVIFCAFLPCSVMYDHLPNSWLSFPLFIFRDRTLLSVIIAVPPGLYIKSQFKLVSDVVTVAPF